MQRRIALKDFTILIVDDTKSNLLLLRLLLEEHGVDTIYEANSAKEAFQILEEQAIDAILLDVMMPEIDGIQACTTIRSNSKFDLIPIIMVTANNDDATLSKSFNAGADDFLSKPVNTTILLSRLQSQLQRVQFQKKVLHQSRFSAMNEMTSMLAHQWRQPLSLISTISNTMQTKLMLHQLDEASIAEGLEAIESYVLELSKLISSFKENFMSAPVECVSIEALFSNARSKHIALIEEHSIEIISKFSNFSVTLKAKILLKIVSNLFINAIEALIKSNTKQPKIYLEAYEDRDVFTLSISDNANVAISKEVLPHIFDPYFTTKMERNGKGLGLFFVKTHIENELHGTITVATKPGNTTFTITLPKILC